MNEKQQLNRLDWGLRELDVSAPNGLTGIDLIQWSRRKLMDILEDPTVEPKDKAAAGRALLSSGHAEVEFVDKCNAREQAKESGALPPQLASLPREDRIKLLSAAIPRLQEELARELGQNPSSASNGILAQGMADSEDGHATDED